MCTLELRELVVKFNSNYNDYLYTKCFQHLKTESKIGYKYECNFIIMLINSNAGSKDVRCYAYE